ncbi:MAG: sulfatase [Deltaproteobacteria bacterium]|nr:sulfatase [Deltaproteobacteria bacterium]
MRAEPSPARSLDLSRESPVDACVSSARVRYGLALMSTDSPLLSKRWPWLTAAAVVLLVYLATLVEVGRLDPDDRPVGTSEDIAALRERDDLNVLFIVIDTLRAERLGAWGYERDTSPLLDRLASQGIRFDRHLSQSSWTKCSMASLWTGLYPARTGVTRFEQVLSPEAKLPAEILSEAGFRTAGLFRNGWVEGYFGFDQGFDVYTRPVGRPAAPNVRRQNPTIKEVGTDIDAVRASEEFLRIYGHERWFLYLHLMDVHEYLYDEDSARFGTNFSDIYDNAILHTNFILDQLYDHLGREGYLDHTLIVIASDHGEAFGERGIEGHARFVYRETTEVPLILSLPFKLEPGVVVDQRTANVDIWPTILDLLGLPAMQGVDGHSQRPSILAAARGEDPPVRDGPAYAHLDQNWGKRGSIEAPTVAVSDGDYRFVLTQEGGRGWRQELFDRRHGAAESDNLAEIESEIAARMRAVAEGYLESEPPWQGRVQDLEIDEIKLNQLRALGYQIP